MKRGMNGSRRTRRGRIRIKRTNGMRRSNGKEEMVE